MIRYVLNTLGSVRSALAVGFGLPFLVAASAYAQAPAPEATTERVIVTGSYIPTAETESALPVTVYTAEVLQKQGAQTQPATARVIVVRFLVHEWTLLRRHGRRNADVCELRVAIGMVAARARLAVALQAVALLAQHARHPRVADAVPLCAQLGGQRAHALARPA